MRKRYRQLQEEYDALNQKYIKLFEEKSELEYCLTELTMQKQNLCRSRMEKSVCFIKM